MGVADGAGGGQSGTFPPGGTLVGGKTSDTLQREREFSASAWKSRQRPAGEMSFDCFSLRFVVYLRRCTLDGAVVSELARAVSHPSPAAMVRGHLGPPAV